MRLDKIYTKIGDKGHTLLATGSKVSKASLRIDAYGTVDELNSNLGQLKDSVKNYKNPRDDFKKIDKQILTIQHELFNIGAELATPQKEGQQKMNPTFIAKMSVTRLELEIDAFNQSLEPLSNFVLPGGHLLNSNAHINRCICRRAERAVIKLDQEEPIREEIKI